MTVLEASGKLFAWFKENDTFEMESDFKQAVLVSLEEAKDRAAFLLALVDLQEMGMVKACEMEGKKYWVLLKAFGAYEQSVKISPPIAEMIATVVNGYCEVIELDSEKCDPCDLQENDIKNLLFITNECLHKDGPQI